MSNIDTCRRVSSGALLTTFLVVAVVFGECKRLLDPT